MVPSDLEEVLSLALAEGWVSDMCELLLILRSCPEKCFAVVSGCKVIGYVMVTRYKHSTWIGNLIVDRHYRMRGVGTKLLQTAVEHLDSDSTITSIYLNAAPSAVRLYQRFGFVEVGDVFRWRKNGGSDNDTAQFAASSQEIGICRREDILWLDSQCWGALGSARTAHQGTEVHNLKRSDCIFDVL
jgi:GNAT superfamily N-acetyltransferase